MTRRTFGLFPHFRLFVNSLTLASTNAQRFFSENFRLKLVEGQRTHDLKAHDDCRLILCVVEQSRIKYSDYRRLRCVRRISLSTESRPDNVNICVCEVECKHEKLSRSFSEADLRAFVESCWLNIKGKANTGGRTLSFVELSSAAIELEFLS